MKSRQNIINQLEELEVLHTISTNTIFRKFPNKTQ